MDAIFSGFAPALQSNLVSYTNWSKCAVLVGEVRVVGFWGLLTTQGRGLLSFNAPVGGDRKLLTLLP